MMNLSFRRIIVSLLVPCLLVDSVFASASSRVLPSYVSKNMYGHSFSDQAITAQLRSRFFGRMSDKPSVRQIHALAQYEENEMDAGWVMHPDGTLSIDPFGFLFKFAKKKGDKRRGDSTPRESRRPSFQEPRGPSRRNWLMGAVVAVVSLIQTGGRQKEPVPTIRENLMQWAVAMRLIDEGKMDEANQARSLAARGAQAIAEQGDKAWATHIDSFFTRFAPLLEQKRSLVVESPVSAAWRKNMTDLAYDLNTQYLSDLGYVLLPLSDTRQGFIIGTVLNRERLEINYQHGQDVETYPAPLYWGEIDTLGEKMPEGLINERALYLGTREKPTFFATVSRMAEIKAYFHAVVDDQSPTSQQLITYGYGESRNAMLKGLRADGWIVSDPVRGNRLKEGFDDAWEHNVIQHEVGHFIVQKTLRGIADEITIRLHDMQGILRSTVLALYMFNAAQESQTLLKNHVARIDLHSPVTESTSLVLLAYVLAHHAFLTTKAVSWESLAQDTLKLNVASYPTVADHLMDLSASDYEMVLRLSGLTYAKPPIQGTWTYKRFPNPIHQQKPGAPVRAAITPRFGNWRSRSSESA